jgi:ribosomal protein S12 methylthiotransferase
MKKTIHLISLGCAKNLVDSERLLGSALASFRPVADPAEADLIIVNTCAFLQSATEEALEAIMAAGAAKKPGAKLVVAGCLPARYEGRERISLAAGLPEVDLFLSPPDYPRFEAELAKLMHLKTPPPVPAFAADGGIGGGRVLSTPPFRAYLKISEGCDNRCTYCLIPRLRGPLKSEALERLAREAEELADSGVKELTLVAQDLTSYGRDRNEKEALIKLAKRLSATPGLEWLRLLYVYPERLTEKLVKTLADTPKVVPYLDVPFQHGAPDVLRRMGRRADIRPLALVEKLRSWWPGLALRSTMIVGFPGETEKDFEQLAAFVSEAAFDHLGVFKYSSEEHTPASRMAEQTPPHLKEKRRRRLMAIQRKISLRLNRGRVGQTTPVLVEGPAPDSGLVVVGRASFQAPEVDGLIYFEGPSPRPGAIVPTLLTKAAPYDLVGTTRED